ncbi:MAG TPA: tetratricopeptide repeat protein, partial [Pyrinomonadaceae bacterium]|nr:tetratricopeptide repeat protein [Pyrinomonadaceae bacterium]
SAVEPQPLRQITQQDLDTADALFVERTDVEKMRTAVATLNRLRDPAVRNYEVEWRFAMFSYFLGKALNSQTEAEAVFSKGKDAGLIASRVEPGRPEGHFWYGANLGELAQLSPVTVGVRSVDEIRDAIQRVIEIDPGYQWGSSYAAMARVEMKTRLFGGRAEKAVSYLEKGVEIAPLNSMIRADLAEAYLAVRRDADARRQIDALLKLEPHPDYRPEHAEAVEKVKRLARLNF